MPSLGYTLQLTKILQSAFKEGVDWILYTVA